MATCLNRVLRTYDSHDIRLEKNGAASRICTHEAFATAYKAVPFVYSGIAASKILTISMHLTGTSYNHVISSSWAIFTLLALKDFLQLFSSWVLVLSHLSASCRQGSLYFRYAPFEPTSSLIPISHFNYDYYSSTGCRWNIKHTGFDSPSA